MMKYKVCELEGARLDAAVAKALGYASPASVQEELCGTWYAGESDGGVKDWTPSVDWQQAGPIIERNLITVAYDYKTDQWGGACCDDQGRQISAFHYRYPLIAAMRAYVISRLGDEVEL